MIDWVLQIFIYIIITDAVLSYLPDINRQAWAKKLHEFANIPQKPIRDLLPPNMPLDPSPMIVIIICQILMYLI
jgi:uncharacterized protein YggT (Ycf19 family)